MPKNKQQVKAFYFLILFLEITPGKKKKPSVLFQRPRHWSTHQSESCKSSVWIQDHLHSLSKIRWSTFKTVQTCLSYATIKSYPNDFTMLLYIALLDTYVSGEVKRWMEPPLEAILAPASRLQVASTPTLRSVDDPLYLLNSVHIHSLKWKPVFKTSNWQ